jgi:hypothetical protein
MDLGPGIGVVIRLPGIEPGQFDSLNSGPSGCLQPSSSGHQHGMIASICEAQAKRESGKGVPGFGPGDHDHPHRAYPATIMTAQAVVRAEHITAEKTVRDRIALRSTAPMRVVPKLSRGPDSGCEFFLLIRTFRLRGFWPGVT